MQFDLFYEIALPPQLALTETQVYHNVIDQAVLGDALGFGCAWFVEHHAMPAYSHCSKPELVLAALSQLTQRIRLGLAIVPLPYHHPIHVAEKIATLDVLSQGRLEAGIGRGFAPAEYALFGREMRDSRALVDEALAIIRASFSGKINHAGSHFEVRDFEVAPRVVQTPHPPLWSAAVSPDSFVRIAEQGLNVLAGPFKPWFMVESDIAAYKKAWRGEQAPRIGMSIALLCLRDGKRAREIAREAFTWFYRELLKTTTPVLEKLYPSYEHFASLGRFRELMRLGINLKFLETFGMAVAGSPAECIAALERYRAAGVTNLLCGIGAGAVEHAIARESMEVIAAEVMPHFTA